MQSFCRASYKIQHRDLIKYHSKIKKIKIHHQTKTHGNQLCSQTVSKYQSLMDRQNPDLNLTSYDLN
ncbi:hypothetical protein BpHYR1_018432 [Brachionus plicatilis]|uniref:Uncharacterized protein n=1 Tax=Brachionus plicatilis TaxID=10195 RepID=A0A3M7PDW4_BRAPC|nr:hypothetical protein BpHYR1_018432 [Brachionus plicatilis]